MCTFDEAWLPSINLKAIESVSFSNFESRAVDRIVKQPDYCFNFNKHIFKATVTQNDNDLRNLVEKNKELRAQIDSKLEDLSIRQTQYEIFKKDQKLLTQEIKETHEAFLMGKKFYKKYLKMYHTIESRNGDKQTIYVQFFTETKKDSDNFSVRLLRNTKNGHYDLLSTTPPLLNMKELQRKLQESNDIPGALCSLRQMFLTMKPNKKY